MADPGDIDPDDVSPHVHVKIDAEKKIRWLQYAEENYHGNLSTLVVEAVDNTISDNWVLESEAESEIDAASIDVDLSGVDGDLDDIKSQLTALSEQMDNLTLSGSAPDDDELDERDLMRLANRVRDMLPEAPNEWTLLNVFDAHSTVEESERVRLTGTVSDLADYLEEPRYHVWDAAVFLENKDEHVKSVIDDGTRRWFVHNPRVEIPEFDVDEEDIPEDVEFKQGSEVE